MWNLFENKIEKDEGRGIVLWVFVYYGKILGKGKESGGERGRGGDRGGRRRERVSIIYLVRLGWMFEEIVFFSYYDYFFYINVRILRLWDNFFVVMMWGVVLFIVKMGIVGNYSFGKEMM